MQISVWLSYLFIAMRIQCPVAERRGFSVLVLRTLKSLAQLPHPSPLDAHSLLKNGEVPRASPGPGASHSLPLYLECELTWALTSALSTGPRDVLRFPICPPLSLDCSCGSSVPGPWWGKTYSLLTSSLGTSFHRAVTTSTLYFLNASLKTLLEDFSCGVIRVSTK